MNELRLINVNSINAEHLSYESADNIREYLKGCETIDVETLPIVKELREKLKKYENNGESVLPLVLQNKLGKTIYQPYKACDALCPFCPVLLEGRLGCEECIRCRDYTTDITKIKIEVNNVRKYFDEEGHLKKGYYSTWNEAVYEGEQHEQLTDEI